MGGMSQTLSPSGPQEAGEDTWGGRCVEHLPNKEV